MNVSNGRACQIDFRVQAEQYSLFQALGDVKVPSLCEHTSNSHNTPYPTHTGKERDGPGLWRGSCSLIALELVLMAFLPPINPNNSPRSAPNRQFTFSHHHTPPPPPSSTLPPTPLPPLSYHYDPPPTTPPPPVGHYTRLIARQLKPAEMLGESCVVPP